MLSDLLIHLMQTHNCRRRQRIICVLGFRIVPWNGQCCKWAAGAWPGACIHVCVCVCVCACAWILVPAHLDLCIVTFLPCITLFCSGLAQIVNDTVYDHLYNTII